jgi:hypothetical protein
MSARPPAARALCCCCLAGTLAASARRAGAYDVEVSSSTTAQGYALRSPWGEPIVSRRRFTQTLGLHVTGLEGLEPEAGRAPASDQGPLVSFRARMRLDTDFGIWDQNLLYRGNEPTFVPGLQREPVDLMYGYFDVRRLARGLLSARLGRQLVVDSLGWWSFDGALMRVELPVYLAFETYGGFEQRGGMPLSTPRFERDGVWRGDRTGLDANVYPEYLPPSAAPAYGVVVESFGLPALHVRGAYRKVWNTGTVTTSPFTDSPVSPPRTYSGMRISSERFGASADLLIADAASVRTGATYDLLASVVSSLYGTFDVFPAAWLTLGVDADRFVPTFDGDSIWNWFAHWPATTVLARADAAVGRPFDVSVSGGARWLETTLDPIDWARGARTGDAAHVTDGIARANGRLRWASGRAGLGGVAERGERGDREGVDLHGEQVLSDRYLLSTRLSVYDWRDSLRPERSATSFGYVLGTGYRAGSTAKVLVEWEHDTNRLVGQRYRVLALLQLRVSK